MLRSLRAAGLVAVVVLLTAPASAAARVEGGNPCAANAALADSTAIGLTNPPAPFKLPTIWGGVITSWRVETGAGVGPLAQRLQIFKQTFVEEETRYVKIAETSMETVAPGSNVFATRIPLHDEGPHHLGLHGPAGTLVCDDLPGALSAIAPGEFPAGEPRAVEVESEIGTPVTVISEPDRDGDGFGDETQDGCERLATTQADCPTVALSAVSRATPGAIVVEIGATSEAWVEVKGEVSWRLPRRAAVKGTASKRVGRRFVVTLKATGARTVLPGEVAVFRVPLPRSVKRHLGQLTRGKWLTARLAASAEDLAYRMTSTPLSVKLRGRKPAPRPR